ncbi:MAG: hypothetical protein OXG43_13690 [Chloroflexi bacterium]|nr:hypothetical protein [Chloroflexota bacterium]
MNRIQGQREIIGGATDIPTIVFSTNWPGLVAARELLPEDPASPVICLLQSEFAEFNQRMLDQAARELDRWDAALENPGEMSLDDLALIGFEAGDTRFDYAEFCVHVWSHFVHPLAADPQPDSDDEDDEDDDGGAPGGIEGWPSTDLGSAQHAFPEVNPEQFRVHVVGNLWGPQAGSSQQHLWRWDGRKLELLLEGFTTSVY